MSKEEYRPQPSKPIDQHKPHLEAGNGASGIQPTLNERAKPPPPEKSALNRAVEQTRELYERNGWVFLPWGEVGKGLPGVSTLQGEQQPYSGGINKPELHPPKERPLPFKPNLPRQEQRRIALSAKDQEILALLQKSNELLGKLPHPLAQEFKDQMIHEAVEEAFSKINWEEMQRQIDKMDEELMEALEDPIQRKKLFEDD